MRGDVIQPVTSMCYGRRGGRGALERVSGAPVARLVQDALSMEWERCD